MTEPKHELRILVVVPTYNEIDNLEPLVREIPFEVLIVDDGSPDGTGALADVLAQRNEGRVHVLHRTKKQGLGAAYLAGFQWALEKNSYDALIQMDADFSHSPVYLSEFAKNLKTHDVVVGSRYVRGGSTKNWGILRKIISRGGSLYSRLILGHSLRDFTGGFNGWRIPVLKAIHLESVRSNGYAFQIELKYRALQKQFRILEIPICFEDRKVGHSKMSLKIVFEALLKVWRFRVDSF